MERTIIKTALLNAFATALYIALVASLMFYGPKFLNTAGKADTVLAPVAMLCLFVFSAGLTAFLMFGRPILWYLDGKKKEALSLLTYTLSIFLGLTLVAFAVLLFAK